MDVGIGPQPVYEGASLSQVVFPLGGIGTGFVGLTGSGGLKDFCCFNRPDYGSSLPLTFPLIWAKAVGDAPVCRVLQAPVQPPYSPTAHTSHPSGEGLPHMDSATFVGEFPFATVKFASKKLPVAVSLEAYSPFIPGNPDDSGFPAAILRYTVTNRTTTTVKATVAWSFFNPTANLYLPEKRRDLAGWRSTSSENRRRSEGGVTGLFLFTPSTSTDDAAFGSLSLASPDPGLVLMPYYPRIRGPEVFWDAFSTTGSFPNHEHDPSGEESLAAGAAGVRLTLKPRSTKSATFYLTWYFPNFQKYWGKPAAGRHYWRNYYAGQFADAFDVAVRLHAREGELHERTKLFHDALFSSTLPPAVLDAVSSTMSILRSPTAVRLPDGTFYGFEGCSTTTGCCEGSCTHVWNYAQVLPFLFPSLERSMREADYARNIREAGSMAFRLQLPIGSATSDFLPCVDGQLGGIVKAYRDWKICGSDEWLAKLWPSLSRALEFAWVEWDGDRDGVITGMQHNTYDIELYGANPLSASFYLAALAAGAEMAEHFGETERAASYRELAARGRAWVEKHLFNGEYFEQALDNENEHPYQVGAGCLSDSLLGQWLARLSGLPNLLDGRTIRATLKSILKHNFRSSMYEHACPQHTIVCAFNDDAGLLNCSWPHGGRPTVPIRYHDEVWAGVEYQVASHCIMEGLVDDALRIVKAVRDRHDGIKRNPYDQYECCGGHHYSRVMSSYGLLLAISGFLFDAGTATIGFHPKLHQESFRCFWSLEGGWGTYSQSTKRSQVRVLSGALRLSRLVLPALAKRNLRVRACGKTFTVRSDAGGVIALPQACLLGEGESISISPAAQ